MYAHVCVRACTHTHTFSFNNGRKSSYFKALTHPVRSGFEGGAFCQVTWGTFSSSAPCSVYQQPLAVRDDRRELLREKRELWTPWKDGGAPSEARRPCVAQGAEEHTELKFQPMLFLL